MAELPDDPSMQDPDKDVTRADAALKAAYEMRDQAVAAAGGYVVDPERAQKCIDELARIAADVRMGLVYARGAIFDPPGWDPVSMNVARNGGLMASRAAAYIEAWARQIDTTREALSQQLRAYRDIENANAGRRA